MHVHQHGGGNHNVRQMCMHPLQGDSMHYIRITIKGISFIKFCKKKIM